MDKPKVLGILGGLGPLSSAYFYEMIVKNTCAEKDQDHIDIILTSTASTPDRTEFIMGRSSESPLPKMEADAKLLEKAGADIIVIPCNTAHYFLEELRGKVGVRLLSIIDETAAHIKACGFRKAAILATEGTVATGSYQTALEKLDIGYEVPDEKEQSVITDIIYGDVKKGIIPEKEKIYSAMERLFGSGCDCAILGCTELSLLGEKLKDDGRFVDSIEALADSAIKLFGKKTRGFPEGFANYSI